MHRENIFQLGPHTLPISVSVHKLNRDRLITKLRNDSLIKPNSVVLLMGGKTQHMYDTDIEPIFRQESYFHWTFGVREPDFYGTIDLVSGKSCLFVPKLDESYAVWMGRLHSLDDFRNRYEVEEVYYTEQVYI